MSHEPPHRVRDRCLRGTHVGSASLRSAVERMPERGSGCVVTSTASGAAERVRFGGGRSRGAPAQALVCNAANANDGYATRLVTVPTVIDLVDDEEPCENNSS